MSCNRIRLTSDGKLRNCLFSLEETDVRALLARRRPRRRDRPGDSRLRGLEVGRARDQYRPVHPARAADALDRRLNASTNEYGIRMARVPGSLLVEFALSSPQILTLQQLGTEEGCLRRLGPLE